MGNCHTVGPNEALVVSGNVDAFWTMCCCSFSSFLLLTLDGLCVFGTGVANKIRITTLIGGKNRFSMQNIRFISQRAVKKWLVPMSSLPPEQCCDVRCVRESPGDLGLNGNHNEMH